MRGTSSLMPDDVVMTGEHQDADPIFDAGANQAVILSFNLQADLMGHKPQHTGEVSDESENRVECHRTCRRTVCWPRLHCIGR